MFWKYDRHCWKWNFRALQEVSSVVGNASRLTITKHITASSHQNFPLAPVNRDIIRRANAINETAAPVIAAITTAAPLSRTVAPQLSSVNALVAKRCFNIGLYMRTAFRDSLNDSFIVQFATTHVVIAATSGSFVHWQVVLVREHDDARISVSRQRSCNDSD